MLNPTKDDKEVKPDKLINSAKTIRKLSEILLFKHFWVLIKQFFFICVWMSGFLKFFVDLKWRNRLKFEWNLSKFEFFWLCHAKRKSIDFAPFKIVSSSVSFNLFFSIFLTTNIKSLIYSKHKTRIKNISFNFTVGFIIIFLVCIFFTPTNILQILFMRLQFICFSFRENIYLYEKYDRKFERFFFGIVLAQVKKLVRFLFHAKIYCGDVIWNSSSALKSFLKRFFAGSGLKSRSSASIIDNYSLQEKTQKKFKPPI